MPTFIIEISNGYGNNFNLFMKALEERFIGTAKTKYAELSIKQEIDLFFKYNINKGDIDSNLGNSISSYIKNNIIINKE